MFLLLQGFKVSMSAEPERCAPYSSDLRWRIVWQCRGMERSLRTIAESLNISLGTAFNVFNRLNSSAESIREMLTTVQLYLL